MAHHFKIKLVTSLKLHHQPLCTELNLWLLYIKILLRQTEHIYNFILSLYFEHSDMPCTKIIQGEYKLSEDFDTT